MWLNVTTQPEGRCYKKRQRSLVGFECRMCVTLELHPGISPKTDIKRDDFQNIEEYEPCDSPSIHECVKQTSTTVLSSS